MNQEIKTIWIIGPDSKRVDLMRQMLIGQGYNPVRRNPVMPAYADVYKDKPLLIILLSQIGMDLCEDFCRRLSVISEDKRIPVMLVCNWRCRLEWMEGLDIPLDVLHTPYSREGFILHVRQIMRHRIIEEDQEKSRLALLQAQRMECIGALAAGVAHEFNNLMFAVMGFAEMAKLNGGKDLEALRESAEVSYESAQRAATIASSLLAFTRQAQSAKELGNLNDAVQSSIKLLRKNIEHDGIKLLLNLDDNLPDSMMAVGPVQQMVLNLFINAWHALRDVSNERLLEISTAVDEADTLVLEIKDTGCGIPEDIVGKVFDPFFTTKEKKSSVQHIGGERKSEGTGLGLSIVRQVIDSHGGSIDVKSKLGEGTVFSVHLPLVEAADFDQESQKALSDEEFSALKGKRIVVIDDDEGSRHLLSRLLSRRGYAVWTAASMVEAHHLIWSHNIDLLLLDIVLCGENGIELCGQLRKNGFTMPIILYTGMLHSNSREAAMEAGADELIYKPFRADQLFEIIEKFTANQPDIPAS